MNTRTLTCRALCLALSLTACASAHGDVARRDEPVTPIAKPRAASAHADHDNYPAASNAFGFDMWHAVAAKDNLTIAPASISLALGMTWVGARGTTAEEMRHVLHFGRDKDALVASMGQQLRAWNDPTHDAYKLAVVDRLFGEKTATFEPDFLATMQRSFGAPLELVDFIDGFEAARAHINDWVEHETKDRIVDLLPPDSLDTYSRLVLTNAVYFKGDWQRPFDVADTHPGTFQVGGTRPKTVPMMGQVASFDYAHTDGVQIVELPYAGGDLALDIVLPDAKDGLPALAGALDDARFAALVGKLQPSSVAVTLPKFKLEMSTSLALKPVLKQLGMPGAFTPDADFTGMSTTIHPLFIDDVYHKTFVAVDEEGTEAAAATAVVMTTEGMAVEPEGIPFVADHPFVFVLRDVHSGTILFLGQLVDPA